MYIISCMVDFAAFLLKEYSLYLSLQVVVVDEGIRGVGVSSDVGLPAPSAHLPCWHFSSRRDIRAVLALRLQVNDFIPLGMMTDGGEM